MNLYRMQYITNPNEKIMLVINSMYGRALPQVRDKTETNTGEGEHSDSGEVKTK
jgi:hypothetical protein